MTAVTSSITLIKHFNNLIRATINISLTEKYIPNQFTFATVYTNTPYIEIDYYHLHRL
jgi:hypothetical protein